MTGIFVLDGKGPFDDAFLGVILDGGEGDFDAGFVAAFEEIFVAIKAFGHAASNPVVHVAFAFG